MHRPFKVPALTACLIGLMGLALHLTPLGLSLEEYLDLQVLFHLRGSRPVPAEVVIVSLDRESVEALGLPANPVKWPRTLYANLTRGLAERGAAVIVYDVFFGEATSEDDDRGLAEAFTRAGNVLVCELIRRELIPVPGGDSTSGTLYVERLVQPTQRIVDGAAALAPYPLPKVPTRVSQLWRFKTEAGCTPTLPFLAFQLFSLDLYHDFMALLAAASPMHAAMFPADGEAIRLGRSIGWLTASLRTMFEENPGIAARMLAQARDRDGIAGEREQRRRLEALIKAYTEPDSVFLNFYGPPGTIATVPFHQVLPGSGADSSPPGFQGKVVFVGLSELLSAENRDGFHTVFSTRDGIDLSGVEIAATAFANLLDQQSVRPAPPAIFVGAILVGGLVLGGICYLLPPFPSLVGMVGAGLIYLFAATVLFTKTATWIPLTVPFGFEAPLAWCAGFFWHHAGAKNERAQIRKAFGFFLPDRVIDQIITDMRAARDIAHTGQTLFGVVLCSDGSQYTSLSEAMHPKDLSVFLNRYYEAIFQPVKAHRGTISDIIGDSMLAVWAKAHPDATLKQDACRAALEVMTAVDHFNRRAGPHQLHTRIGLHYGELLLGTVGGSGHFEFRPVGDVVNTASRIEGLNKSFGTRILVSQEVMEDVSGFLTRELGRFRVYGKTNPITVFELIGPIETVDEIQIRICELFAEALGSFRSNNWDQAEDLFIRYLSIVGEDEMAQHYLQECARYKLHPPDENWDGLVHCNRK